MKINHILGSGCSFVKNGWVYQEGEKDNWSENDIFTQDPNDFPKMVGKNLGITADNIARPGSGTQFSMHSVYLWVKNNPDKVKNTLLLFGVTALQRGTFFVKAKFPDRMKDDGIPDDFPNHLTPNYYIPKHEKDYRYWEARGFDGEEVAKFFELYYKIAHNNFHWENWQKQQLIMFEAYLNSIGLNHIFINTLASSQHGKEDLHYLKNLYIFPDGSDNWLDFIKSYEDRYKLLHPTVYDHKKLADNLSDYIKEKYEV